MKKRMIVVLAAVLTLSGCSSYNQFGATATGSSLGGMLGSAVGGILGGSRGYHAGSAIGMVVGGVAGAATAQKIENRRAQKSADVERGDASCDDVRYSSLPEQSHRGASVRSLQVDNVEFSDRNNNRALDAGEETWLSFDIYNNSSEAVYDVSPVVTVSSKRVEVSPPAVVSVIAPGQGVRYRAMLVGQKNLKNGRAEVRIAFRDKKRVEVAKAFMLDLRR